MGKKKGGGAKKRRRRNAYEHRKEGRNEKRSEKLRRGIRRRRRMILLFGSWRFSREHAVESTWRWRRKSGTWKSAAETVSGGEGSRMIRKMNETAIEAGVFNTHIPSFLRGFFVSI